MSITSVFLVLSMSGSVLASDAEHALRLGQYRDVAERIVTAVREKNDAYLKMQQLCDDIGHRLSGSPQLQRAIEWAAETLRADAQQNVHLEPVEVPHWVRGKESLTLNAPKVEELAMIGLGGSVGTPPHGITAPVVVVTDEQELDTIGEDAAGKIVVFNHPMPQYDPSRGTGYGSTVRFRTNGARLAAEKGAVAALVRSVTANSLQTPHTGAMRYGDAEVRIPSAAISVEAAELLARFQARGIPSVATLKMEARTLPDAMSANVIAELRGSTHPEEIVVIGGHIDSWDAGQGAHDDAAGCVTAMEALNVLRKLQLRPRRTIRVVLWTNEENGLRGAKQYALDHADEMDNHVAAIESDAGCFRTTGFRLECRNPQRQDISLRQLDDILKLLQPHFGEMEVNIGGSGADVGAMREDDVVLMGHAVDMSTYFNYHHSPADTLDKIDPQLLSNNVAIFALVSYVLADMPERLGQNGTEHARDVQPVKE